MSRNIRPSGKSFTLYEIPHGGLGVSNLPEFYTVFNAVPLNTKNQPLGPAGLNDDKTLPMSIIDANNLSTYALIGPSTVYTGSVVEYKISNFDSFTTYEVSCNKGQLLRQNDTISFQVPASPGPVVLVINSREYNISVVAVGPSKPVIAANTVLGYDGVHSTLIMTSSAFAMPEGFVYTHASTDWEVSAVEAGLTRLVASSYDDSQNKTRFVFTEASPLYSYQVRCRHRDDRGNESPWSEIVLTAVLNDTASLKQTSGLGGVVTLNNGVNNVSVTTGEYLAATPGGSRTFISQGIAGQSPYRILCAFNEGDYWRVDSIVQAPVLNTALGYPGSAGYAVLATNSDGTRLAASYPEAADAHLREGVVEIFERQVDNWSLVQRLYSPNPVADGLFGVRVAMTPDAQTVFVFADKSGVNTTPVLYIYTYNSSVNTYALAQVLTSSEVGDDFGEGFALSEDGHRFAASAPGATVNGSSINTGRVYVYSRSYSSGPYALETELTNLDAGQTERFGSSMDFDGPARTLAVGSKIFKQTNTSLNKGIVRIYRRQANVWTLQSVINRQANYTQVGEMGSSVFLSSDAQTLYVVDSQYMSGKGTVERYNYNSQTFTYNTTGVSLNPAAGEFTFGLRAVCSSAGNVLSVTTNQTGYPGQSVTYLHVLSA